MPQLKTYDLFISHAWTYSSEYNNLIGLLDSAPCFIYRNYSVPEDDPLHVKTKKELYNALCRQIRPVNIVIVLSGMYVPYREWIQNEIEIAQYYDKPIIGIVPWGQQRVPSEVRNVAKEMIGWNTSSVVDAIRVYSL